LSKTILTVDDSRTMRDMLAMALNDAGFNVVQAVDGEDGLAVLDAHSTDVDVIITDINMPKLDGFGFIEGVRKDARHRATPILVLTTESDSSKKDRARQAGATGWIVKPFNPVKLIDAIRRVAA
jgi:two-component system, chemotaxis family, chemotaxis protein CheY